MPPGTGHAKALNVNTIESEVEAETDRLMSVVTYKLLNSINLLWDPVLYRKSL